MTGGHGRGGRTRAVGGGRVCRVRYGRYLGVAAYISPLPGPRLGSHGRGNLRISDLFALSSVTVRSLSPIAY